MVQFDPKVLRREQKPQYSLRSLLALMVYCGAFASILGMTEELFSSLDRRRFLTLGLAVRMIGCWLVMLAFFVYWRYWAPLALHAMLLLVLFLPMAVAYRGSRPGLEFLGSIAMFLLWLSALLSFTYALGIWAFDSVGGMRNYRVSIVVHAARGAFLGLMIGVCMGSPLTCLTIGLLCGVEIFLRREPQWDRPLFGSSIAGLLRASILHGVLITLAIWGANLYLPSLVMSWFGRDIPSVYGALLGLPCGALALAVLQFATPPDRRWKQPDTDTPATGGEAKPAADEKKKDAKHPLD